MKFGQNIRFKTELLIFWSYSFLYFQSFGSYFGHFFCSSGLLFIWFSGFGLQYQSGIYSLTLIKFLNFKYSVNRTHSQDREDPAFGGIGVGYPHRTTANSCNNTLHRRSSATDRDRGSRSPAAASHGSGSSSLRMRATPGRHGSSSSPPPRGGPTSRGQNHSTLDHPRSDSRLFDPNGVDTVSNADGGMTPGSTFDASEVDRFDITFGLRAKRSFVNDVTLLGTPSSLVA